MRHDDDVVAHGEQSTSFTSVTLGAPVPETPVKFVDDLGLFIVPIHEEGFVTLTNHVFPSVPGVSNVDVGFTVHVGQPFQGRKGMGFALRMPTADGFGGQVAFWHVFGTVKEIAGGSNGDTAL